jgi:two-component system OmpR family sensor kinase
VEASEEAESRFVAVELAVAMGAVAAVVAVGGAFAGRWLAGHALAPIRDAAEHTRRAARAGAGDVLLPVRGVDDEWDQLASAVNEVLRLQERSLSRARTFSANAAHELRTPLQAMLGQVQVALRRARSAEEYRGALADVEAEAIRMAEVVDALLTLSRSDAGELHPTAGTFDLRAVAAEAVRGPGGDPAPALFLPSSATLARGDSLLTRRILENLIDNARRHGGPTVEVRVAPGDGAAVVSVTDDGPGLPPAVRARLFERFNREPGAADGHGLGLALAHALTAAQGGALRLEEAPGRTRFVLELPSAAS